ncbi:MAG: sigma-54 dependent transcriptional regulator [Deltaproteobacteria bacterium]|nr:sigma-54 dependent transcriptional regulator [Deltaproteobacteria bacterium]
MGNRILVVDDEANLRDVLGKILSAEGYAVTGAADGAEGLRLLAAERFDIVLCDIRMPGMGGLEFLSEVRARDLAVPVIMMSAFGTIEMAVEAMKRGAYDYVSKPFMSDEILLLLRNVRERERLIEENEALRREIARERTAGGLLYASPAMEEVVRTVGKVRDYAATVLITGESGTGKELVARMLHEGGRRAGKPFVAVNCGAIPETLLESELFGCRKGAFTEARTDRAGLIESADGGSLLLDEIGELPQALQAKLLRFLEVGELRRLGETEVRRVTVRVIAATARNLEAEVAAGRFREDLFYRLNVVRIHVPPLRERREEIPILARHFLAGSCRRYGKPEIRIDPRALELLSGHDWRGNVRELRNLIERCVLLGRGSDLSAEELLAIWRHGATSGDEGAAPRLLLQVLVPLDNPDLKAAVKEVEKQMIRMALERTGGSRPKAAELLGISHPALLYKAREYGLN